MVKEIAEKIATHRGILREDLERELERVMTTEDDATKPNIGVSDEDTVTADGPVAWPTQGTRADKRAVLGRVREAEPSPAQAEVLRIALANERDEDVVAGLMGARLHHEGRELRDDKGRSYRADDLDRIYVEALHAAPDATVRIALHRGFAEFRLRGSTHISGKDADRLVMALRLAHDVDEQRALVDILRERAAFDAGRLLPVMDAWLDDDSRTLTQDDLRLWSSAVEKAKEQSSWRSDKIQLEASERLRRALPRLDGKVLENALCLLGTDLYARSCETALAKYAEHPDWSIRYRAVQGLSRGGDQARSVLRQVLLKATEHAVLDAAWKSLEQIGEEPATIARHAAGHPDPAVAAPLLAERLLNHGHEGTLRAVWPSLPVTVRDALDHHERDLRHHHRFHRPFWHELWYDVFQRNPRNSALTAAFLSLASRPLHEELGVYDFESVTGLRRKDHVEIRVVSTLRFAFLAERTTHEGKSLRAVLERGHDLSMERLSKWQIEFDTTRDRAAELRRELSDLARQLGDDLVAQLRRIDPEAPRGTIQSVPDRAGEPGRRFLEVQRAYDQAEEELSPDNEGTAAGRLHVATRVLLPYLREVGCSFEGMAAPDGVLGEYQPADRSITLFGPMIELAARDAVRALSTPLSEVEPLVRTLVEIHELAHAHVHLGRDAADLIWATPDMATARFHEALAQAYTRKLVAKMSQGTPHLEDVLRVMETWLPTEYRYADHLMAADAEALRSYVVGRRSRAPARSQAVVVAGVLRGLPGYARMLGDHGHGTFLAAVATALDEADKALDDPGKVPVALDALLAKLEELPQATTTLGAFLPNGWPSAEERRWLLFEALVAGESVGKRPLRWIRREDYLRAVAGSKSAEEIGLRPAMRASRAELAEVIALPKRRARRRGRGDPEAQEDMSPKRAAGRRKRPA